MKKLASALLATTLISTPFFSASAANLEGDICLARVTKSPTTLKFQCNFIKSLDGLTLNQIYKRGYRVAANLQHPSPSVWAIVIEKQR